MAAESRDSRGRFASTHPDKKFSRGRSKKRPREFFGKRQGDEQVAKKSRPTTSARKLNTSTVQEACDIRNRIVDINILFSELEEIVCCTECHGKIQFSESSIQGLSFKIDVVCAQCGQISAINSSKKVGPKGNACEVNRRSVLALRALGHGHAGLSTLCGIMDFPKPVAQSAYDSINQQLSIACEEVAQESMQLAIQEEKEATPANATGLNISGDGSWRKKGHSSLQGIASINGIETGKVVDVSIKNSFCKACDKWKGREETAEFLEWYEEHKPHCTANHQGSAGQMEVNGICEMFERSEEKYGVRYANYIGDGDSKVFLAVTNTQPYGTNLTVKKKECIGHVQKRMGTRLRNLKKSLAGQKLSDGKTIGGRGRLTGQLIDRLSSYYGKAIRDHSDSVEDMSKAIWATYFHQLSSDKKPRHHLCPKGANSWCKWQKAKARRIKGFKHASTIPSAVMDKIKPIYEDLTNPELLERCLGGFTQNSNESFNNSVWKIVPKTSFSGLTVFKIGVNIAVTCFNDGRTGFLKIMDRFQIQPGVAASEWVRSSDDTRLFHAERKALSNTKEARVNRRIARGEQEDDAYAAGAY